MVEIKNIFGRVIFKSEKATIREACQEVTAFKLYLTGANLRDADLTGANLRDANLRDAYLTGANLRDADLIGANLRDADLTGSDLTGANLRDADLTGAYLTGADLTGAYLTGADLTGANLRDADLTGANLTGANLTGAITDKRYIQVGCIGSAKRLTTYCFDDNIVWCGCFTGSLEEFEKKVRKTHANNEQFLKEYLGLINYIKWNS